MEEKENASITAQTEQFKNRQFNSEVSQLFMEKRGRKEDFDLDIVYYNINRKRKTRISTHKDVLVERSGHFQKMLNPKSNFTEANKSSIYFQFDKDFEIFKTFIDYLYSGVIEIQGGNVFDVYSFSHYINQQDLVEFSIRFLVNNITCETLPQIFSFADSNSISKLTADVQTYVDKNFNDVISKSTDVWEWPSNVLIQVLSSTKMKVKREETVLQVVCKWLNSDFDERKQFMQELFQKLRFSFMSTKDIKVALQEEECKGMSSKIQHQCSISMTDFEEKISSSAKQYPPEEERHYYEGIYCWGERDRSGVFELYWPKNKNMPVKSLAYPSQERSFATMASLNEILYLTGGFTEPNNDMVISNVVEMYDPREHQWSAVASMNIERYDHIPCTCEGKIYVFGGKNKSNDLSLWDVIHLDSEVYDPSTNQWSILRDHPFNKETNVVRTRCTGATAVGTSIFVLYCTGGRMSDASDDDDRLMEYKPKTNEWSELPHHEKFNYLIGYGSMLFLFTWNLKVAIYDTKSKIFHRLEVNRNGFSDLTEINGVARYHDKIVLTLREEPDDDSNNDEEVHTFAYRFAVFDPKVALKTVEDDMSTQNKKIWTCETMSLAVTYGIDLTLAVIY